MSSHRYPRRRKRHARPADLRSSWDPFASGVFLGDNPNRGKRHSARLTDAFVAELARAEIEARKPTYSGAARVPITYRTLVNRDRAGRRLPESRVTETQGYTL